MTEKRHYVAAQQKRIRLGRWRLVNSAARRPQRPRHGPMLAAPAYWLYEMSHAALNPARAFADAARLFFKNPANPLSHTPFGKHDGGELRTVRALDPPLRQAGMEHRLDGRSAASAFRCTSRPSGSGRSAGSCISSGRSSIRRAGRSRACSSSRRCRATTRRCCAAPSRASCPTTTSTSPNGSTPAWCRCRRAASISTTTSTT